VTKDSDREAGNGFCLATHFNFQSVSGTSGGRRISNTRGPLNDVIEATVRIIHNWRFSKPIALTRVRLTSYRVNITISLVIRHKFQHIACSLALNFSSLELRT